MQERWEIAPRVGKYRAMPANTWESTHLAALGKIDFDALSVGLPNGGPQVAIIPLDESSAEKARLVAAAPELLDALKDAAEVIGSMLDRKDLTGGEVVLFAKVSLAAHAAIERAEGM